MEFKFDYKETRIRRIAIEADSLLKAIQKIENQINNEEITLNSSDFSGGEISMPLEDNFLPQLRLYGENVEKKDGLDLIIDFW